MLFRSDAVRRVISFKIKQGLLSLLKNDDGTFADTEYVAKFTAETTVEPEPEPIPIPDPPVPETDPERYWALLNLIATILTDLSSAGMVVTYFKKKKDDDEEEKEQTRANLNADEENEEEEEDKRKKSKFLGLIPGIGAIVAFILTEDMTLKMRLTDKWTIIMAAILLINLLLAFLTRNKKKDNEEEEETQA